MLPPFTAAHLKERQKEIKKDTHRREGGRERNVGTSLTVLHYHSPIRVEKLWAGNTVSKTWFSIRFSIVVCMYSSVMIPIKEDPN